MNGRHTCGRNESDSVSATVPDRPQSRRVVLDPVGGEFTRLVHMNQEEGSCTHALQNLFYLGNTTVKSICTKLLQQSTVHVHSP